MNAKYEELQKDLNIYKRRYLSKNKILIWMIFLLEWKILIEK